ncbi:MAG: B12-binding domain-containing radical SAM protein [Candidatus Helarchaeota archaeon]
MMKILLVNPEFNIGMSRVIKSPPLGVMNIAATVPEHDVKILDLNAQPLSQAQLDREISKFDVLGISLMSTTYGSTLEWLKSAKKNGVTTIVGGFHPTMDPNDVISNSEIDIIVRGEGEATFPELITELENRGTNQLQDVKGITYKDNGRVIHTEKRPIIENMDSLPFAARDLVNYDQYHYLGIPADVIETSRGCPYDCTFCSVQNFWERKWRCKSPLRMVKEVAQVRKNKSRKIIFFVDDNFIMDPKRVKKFCRLLREYGQDRIFLCCQASVGMIIRNPDMLKEMRKAGFVLLFVGFESFKQESLEIMKKHHNINQARKAVKLCHDNGLCVWGSFIVGNIGETRKDTLKTFKIAKEIGTDIFMCNPLTPFPGTVLNEQAIENGWMPEGFTWRDWDLEPVMDTDELSRDEIADLVRIGHKSFYLSKYFFAGRKNLNLLRPKFWWWWKIGPMFISNGLKHFILPYLRRY